MRAQAHTHASKVTLQVCCARKYAKAVPVLLVVVGSGAVANHDTDVLLVTLLHVAVGVKEDAHALKLAKAIE